MSTINESAPAAHQRTQTHFDHLAEQYDDEIPHHIRRYLCDKKAQHIVNALRDIAKAPRSPLKGLDCGCGTGWHIKKLRALGYDVAGVDLAPDMIKQARSNNDATTPLAVASATKLPFSDNTFDFVYFINVLHHLPSRRAQRQALQEARRVLNPAGRLLILDLNCENPLVRLYLNHIFPLTSRIDNDQDELWIPLRSYRHQPGLQLLNVKHFTFIPNLLPRHGFSLVKKIDLLLDRAVRYKTGAHYCVVMKKLAV